MKYNEYWDRRIQAFSESVAELDPDLDAATIVGVLRVHVDSVRTLGSILNAHQDGEDLFFTGTTTTTKYLPAIVKDLIDAGASSFLEIRCYQCGNDKSLSRKDGAGNLICTRCAQRNNERKSDTCVGCGQVRHIQYRDHAGRAFCPRCTKKPAQSYGAILSSILQELSPHASPEKVAMAIESISTSENRLRKAADALQVDQSFLLENAHRGSTSTMALLKSLVEFGVPGFSIPNCPDCNKTKWLDYSLDGHRTCRRCYDISRQEECANCGGFNDIASRSVTGAPLCNPCYKLEDASKRKCAGCERDRNLVTRENGRSYCPDCMRLPIRSCSICDHDKPCYLANTPTPRCENCSALLLNTEPCSLCSKSKVVYTRDVLGEPLCPNCATIKHRCTGCGIDRLMYGVIDGDRYCKSCYKRNPKSYQTCVTCGVIAYIHSFGRCIGCAAVANVHACLSLGGKIPDEVQSLVPLLLDGPPLRTLRWLEKRKPRLALEFICSSRQPITHELLDSAPYPKMIRFIRAGLVRNGALPYRNEAVHSIEVLSEVLVDLMIDSRNRIIFRQYVEWVVIPRLRGLENPRIGQIQNRRNDVRESARFIGFLEELGLSWEDWTLGTYESYCFAYPSRGGSVRNFVRWCATVRGFRLQLPTKQAGPYTYKTYIDTSAAPILILRLMNDETIDARDRAIGLLVSIYALPVSRLASLKSADVLVNDYHDSVSLIIGDSPLELLDPIAGLVAGLKAAAIRRSENVSNTAEWLFPGAVIGEHISPATVRGRLRYFGIEVQKARHHAIRILGSSVNGAVLSSLLGYGMGTTYRWSSVFSAHYNGYAGEVQRRFSNPDS